MQKSRTKETTMIRDLNPVQDVFNWIQKAVPSPTNKNIHVQFGVHLEEVRELLLEVHTNDITTMMMLDATKKNLQALADRLKCESGIVSFPNREATLDAICDQLVTNTGLAYMLQLDPVGAFAEVNGSNWSKFDEEGNPIFNEQGKIVKGPNYKRPDLKPFV